MANSITTVKAREKFAKAHGEGIPIPKITKVGWGTGGVYPNGDVVYPSKEQTSLVGEFLQNSVKEISYPTEDGLTVRFKGTISFLDVGALDKKISTCGLYDEEGDLIAIKNFSSKTIDEDTRIEIEWDEEF